MSERIGKQKNTLEVAQKLSTKTRFSTDECRSLLTIHQRIAALGKVDRLRFREVLHTAFDITDDVMLDRVYRVFDKDNDGIISDHEWVEGVSLLCRGTPDQLIDFCYMVYDINGDKSLAREELSHCLKGGLVPYAGVMNGDEIEEAMREIVEIGMKKLDRDKDGQITQPDFTNACYYDPLLLQSIGPCLPPARSLAAFMAIFTENYRSYSTEWNGEDMNGKNNNEELNLVRIHCKLIGRFQRTKRVRAVYWWSDALEQNQNLKKAKEGKNRCQKIISNEKLPNLRLLLPNQE
ncbi:EF-hand calcium-binding domain-containing protein 1 [Folsomia candida]|uniref:EF-hand calcium-binding domain-containing protein 1 n=1 Tax=Folsomia candida TaxID=158441 RepID=A0A226EN23_FOLCA|nr:EF-hand calcium-binding domain-containing protein 1 [Folsomia candida]